MSSFIQLSYGELCLKKSSELKETSFIDKRKLPEGFWLDLLKDKCPEGLGDASESLQHNRSLEPDDFLNDKHVSPGYHCSQDLGHCNDLLSPKPVTCSEFKTPLNTRSQQQGCKTPSLFSPDDSIYPTPSSSLRGVAALSQSACQVEPDIQLQACHGSQNATTPQFVCTPVTARQNGRIWSSRRTATPDLLAEIMGPGSSRLSCLIAASEDDSFEEWSESMATPPLNMNGPSGDGVDGEEEMDDKAMDEEGLPSSKRIVRVLFSDGACNQSGVIAALASGDETMETDCEPLDQEEAEHDARDAAPEAQAANNPHSLEDLLLESSFQQDEEAKDEDNPVKAGESLRDFLSDDENLTCEVEGVEREAPAVHLNTLVARDSVEREAPVMHVKTLVTRDSVDQEAPAMHVMTPGARDSLKPSLLASTPWSNSALSPSAHFQALAQSTPKPSIHSSSGNPVMTTASPASYTVGKMNRSVIEDPDTSLARDRSVRFASPSSSCVEALVQAACDASRRAGEVHCKLEASDIMFGSPSQSFEMAMARETDKLCSGVERDSRTSGLASSLSCSTSGVFSKACVAPDDIRTSLQIEANKQSSETPIHKDAAVGNGQNKGNTSCGLSTAGLDDTRTSIQSEADKQSSETPINKDDAVKTSLNKGNPSGGLSTAPAADDCGIIKRQSFCKVPGLRRSVRPKRFSYPTASQIVQAETSMHYKQNKTSGYKPRVGCEDKLTTGRTEKDTVRSLEVIEAKATFNKRCDNEDEMPPTKRFRSDEPGSITERNEQSCVVNCSVKGPTHSTDSSGDSKTTNSMTLSSGSYEERNNKSLHDLTAARTISDEVTRTPRKDLTVLCTTVEPRFGAFKPVLQEPVGNVTTTSCNVDCCERVDDQLFDMDALSQFPLESLSSPSSTNSASHKVLPSTLLADQEPRRVLSEVFCGTENVNSFNAATLNSKKPSRTVACTSPLYNHETKEEGGETCTREPPLCTELKQSGPALCSALGSADIGTAGCKGKQVSKEALEKAQAMNEQVDSDFEVAASNSIHQEFDHKEGGMFQSPSTKESLNSPIKTGCSLGTEKIPPEICSPDKGNPCKNDRKVPEFTGFQTASGNNVKISSEALTKARATIEEIDKSLRLHDTPRERSGRSLGSGEVCKTGTIGALSTPAPNETASDALRTSFDNELLKSESKSCRDEDQRAKPAFGGFSTASGKRVHISDSAMDKARTTLSKIDAELESTNSATRIHRKGAPSEMTSLNNMNGPEDEMKIQHGELSSAACQFLQGGSHNHLFVAGDSFQEVPRSNGSDDSGVRNGLDDSKLDRVEELESVAHLDYLDSEFCRDAELSAEPLESWVAVAPLCGSETVASRRVGTSEFAVEDAETCMRTSDSESRKNVDDSLLEELLSDCGRKELVSVDKMKEQLIVDEAGLHSKEATSSGSAFSGFQTASGKKVAVTEEALNSARTIMRRIEGDICGDAHSEAKAENAKALGLQMACGRNGQLDAGVVSAAYAYSRRETDREVAIDNKTAEFSGFQTAGGRNVRLSTEALHKGAQIMRQIDRSIDINTNVSRANKSGSCGFSGFQTARGKNVSLSTEALQKGAQIMRQIDRSIDSNANVSQSNVSGSCGFSGFQTAGGKNVLLSTEALQKGAQIMRQIDRSIDSNKNERQPNVSGSCGFSEFQTAGGKNVQLSTEALQKGAQIMRQIDRSIDSNTNTSQHNVSGSCGFSGFQTAGGKNVQLSTEALQKGAQIMRQIDRSIDSNMNVDQSNVSDSCGFSGFQTAAGKTVKVSDAALAKAKATMSGIDDEIRSFSSESGNLAFQTAGRKSVDISEDALNKAKERIKDIDNNMERDTSVGGNLGPGSGSFKGFHTAGGRKVEVSEEALVKARALFQSDEKRTEETVAVANKGGRTRDTLNARTDSAEDRGMATPILTGSRGADRDEEVSREILESSEALMADESFMDVSECLQEKSENGSLNISPINRPGTTLTGGEQERKRAGESPALMSRLPRRYSTPLLCSEDMFDQNQMQTRKGLKPVTATPSGVLYDRRVQFHTPLLARLANVEKEEAECLRRDFGGVEPLKPLQAVTPGCYRNKKNASPLTSTPLNFVMKRRPSSSSRPQFTTPYRRHDPTREVSPLARCSTSRSAVCSSFEIEDPEQDEPSTKKPRISGPSNLTNAQDSRPGDSFETSTMVKPQLGFLSQLRRSSRRIKLREYVGNDKPGHHSTEELIELGVSPEVLSVTSSSASSFRFSGGKYFSEAVLSSNEGVRTDDGGVLHAGTDGNVGLEEIKSAFLSTPGVDSQLISEQWVINHYRWVVWKLAAMETAFPRQFAGRCLTPEWVLCQLKYRYDREVDHSNRSALKKITERDDVSSRTMVLCVSSISVTGGQAEDPPEKSEQDKENHNQTVAKHSESRNIIEVTDGWYSIRAILDKPLTRLLNDKKIVVGQKLCTYGAELVGSEQAAPPLEAPLSLMLRLHANSTRRARWDCKLGFHSHTHAFPLSLSSLFGDGGLTGCVDVIVLRQYPLQWMEKMSDGTNVFRNSRLEEREARKFEQDRQQRREKLFLKVQEEFEKECRQPGAEKRKSAKLRRRSFSSRDLKDLHDGREIYEALSQASDPDAAKACLDERQVRVLEDYSRSLQDRRRGELQNRFERIWKEQGEQHQNRRNVVSLLKVRIADYSPRSSTPAKEEGRNAVLSIWRPSEEVIQLLTEGSRLRIYNLTAAGKRYRQGTSELQLSATRTTRYEVLPSDPDARSLVYSPRQACSFDQLKSASLQPYTEVDLVGLVVFTSPLSSFSHSSSSVQTIYIADEESSLVALKFWGGLKAFAVEDLVKPRSFICCSNLVVRPDDRLPCPSLCFSDLSTVALRPRLPHLRAALDSLQFNITNMDVFMAHIQTTLDSVLRPNRTSPLAEVKGTTVRVYGRSPDTESSTSSGNKNSESKGLAYSTKKEIRTAVDTGTSNPTEYNRSSSCPGLGKSCEADGLELPKSSGLATPSLSTKSRQSKRKLLDSYSEPPPLSPLTSSIPASVRREFQRPRRVGSAATERIEQ